MGLCSRRCMVSTAPIEPPSRCASKGLGPANDSPPVRTEAPGIRNTNRKKGPALIKSAARLSRIECAIADASRKSGMRSRTCPTETLERAWNEYQVRTTFESSVMTPAKPAKGPKNRVNRRPARPRNQGNRDRSTKARVSLSG